MAGKSVVFEDRPSGGRNERWPDLAAELVRLNVQIIVTSGTPAALAAKRASATIPIIMAVTGDPLSTGLVSSLAHPGGNVTGLMQLGAGLAAKRLELLKEVVPNIVRLAFLWNPEVASVSSLFGETLITSPSCLVFEKVTG